ncbi:hypothetical protein, partial [Hydrogenovibrio marinus]
LILQKAVFLAQLLGVDLGYRYNWYVRGPYSPDLASDYYRFTDLGDYENVDFAENVKERIAHVRELLEYQKEEHKGDWLEALASIAFLVTKSNKTIGQAKAVVAEVKDHISEEIRDKAAEVLQEQGLI